MESFETQMKCWAAKMKEYDERWAERKKKLQSLQEQQDVWMDSYLTEQDRWRRKHSESVHALKEAQKSLENQSAGAGSFSSGGATSSPTFGSGSMEPAFGFSAADSVGNSIDALNQLIKPDHSSPSGTPSLLSEEKSSSAESYNTEKGLLQTPDSNSSDSHTKTPFNKLLSRFDLPSFDGTDGEQFVFENQASEFARSAYSGVTIKAAAQVIDEMPSYSYTALDNFKGADGFFVQKILEITNEAELLRIRLRWKMKFKSRGSHSWGQECS